MDAVALYEQGLERLQRHDYSGAAERLESVLRQYPDEKELHERVRLYLNVCRKQASNSQGRSADRRGAAVASTLALNGGRYDEAISHLRLVRDEDLRQRPRVSIACRCSRAARDGARRSGGPRRTGDCDESENRALARTDPDLDPLRGDDAFTRGARGAADDAAGTPATCPPTFRAIIGARPSLAEGLRSMTDLHVVILAAGKGTG